VILPELLGGVLACDTLQNFTWLANELSGTLHERHTLLPTGMIVLKLGQIVHILVDNDPKVVGLVVRRNVGGRKSLRHGCCSAMRGRWKERKKVHCYKRVLQREQCRTPRINSCIGGRGLSHAIAPR
jgi:hypothetical protein